MDNQLLEEYAAFRPAWKAFAVYMFGVAVFWVGPVFNPQALGGPALGQLIGTLFLAFILIKRYTNIYRVGAQEVSLESTFPSRRSLSIPIKNIRRIDLRRGAIQRLLDVAHVHVFVEGQEEAALKLFGVPRPTAFRQLLIELGAEDRRVTGAWRR